MSPSELLPFQRQKPFAWPIDPTASDPTKREFWIAWAAAKCASDPSVEALWGHVCYAAHALQCLKRALRPTTDVEELRATLLKLEEKLGRHLPRRCFRLYPNAPLELGAAIGLRHHVAGVVDLLAEELVSGWEIRDVMRMGNCDTYRDAPLELIRQYRDPEAWFPRSDAFMGRAACAALERTAMQISHFGLPMPWAAGLLAVVEQTTGKCDAACPVKMEGGEVAYLLRHRKPERSLVLRVPLGEEPELGPAMDAGAFDGLSSSHPLFMMFGDGLPRLFDEYRAWRALAGKPIFQDTCKWHPDDDEIV